MISASTSNEMTLAIVLIIIGVILLIASIIVIIVSVRKNKRKSLSGAPERRGKEKEYDFFDTPPKRDIFDLNGDGSYEDEADFSKGFQIPSDNKKSQTLNATPTCPGCGSPLDGGEKFCPYCGKKF